MKFFKRLGIGPKMIGLFVAAVAGAIIVCAIIIYSRVSSILNNNMKLSAQQTVEESISGLQMFEKNIAIPVDLLTRKDCIKKLYTSSSNYNLYIKSVKDELVAATKVVDGVKKAFYATSNGKYFAGYTYYSEDLGKTTTAFDEYDEFHLEDEWYVNCQGVDAGANGVYAYFSHPFIDSEGDFVIIVSQEVKTGGQVVGVVGIVVLLEVIEDYVNSISLLNTGDMYLANETGFLIAGNTNGVTDLSTLDFWASSTEKVKEINEYNKTATEKVSSIATYEGKSNGLDTVYVTVYDDITGWYLVGHITSRENVTSLKSVNKSVSLAAVIGIIIGAGMAVFISTVMIREIKRVKAATEQIAAGDFTQKIVVKRSDEFGMLEHNFNKMIDNVSDLIRKVDDKSEHILEMAGKISDISDETKRTMDLVSEAILAVANGATSQSEQTVQATCEVDDLKNSLDETKEYVEEINEMTHRTTELSSEGLNAVNDLIDKAEQTKVKAKVSMDVMAEMVESIDKIYYITDTISDITEQTNLLSLNASIEAARAGEAGKGFAVVADEIRKLADESSTSTDQIKSIVAEITNKSKQVEAAMKESEVIRKEQQVSIEGTEENFNNILEQINKLAEGMKHITALNDNMNVNKDKVVTGMENIAKVSEQFTTSTEEVNASAEQVNQTMTSIAEYSSTMKTISTELTELISEFKLAE